MTGDRDYGTGLKTAAYSPLDGSSPTGVVVLGNKRRQKRVLVSIAAAVVVGCLVVAIVSTFPYHHSMVSKKQDARPFASLHPVVADLDSPGDITEVSAKIQSSNTNPNIPVSVIQHVQQAQVAAEVEEI